MSDILDISIDLETLAFTPDAVILTIGIADSDGGILALAPSVEQQVANGRRVEDEVLQWWWRQGDAARAALEGPVVSLGEVRAQVQRYFAALKGREIRVWGNAPSFDCEILGHFLRDKPWRFFQERCVRTARELTGYRTKPQTAHCAISDAVAQLHDVRLYRQLAKVVAQQQAEAEEAADAQK